MGGRFCDFVELLLELLAVLSEKPVHAGSYSAAKGFAAFAALNLPIGDRYWKRHTMGRLCGDKNPTPTPPSVVSPVVICVAEGPSLDSSQSSIVHPVGIKLPSCRPLMHCVTQPFVRGVRCRGECIPMKRLIGVEEIREGSKDVERTFLKFSEYFGRLFGDGCEEQCAGVLLRCCLRSDPPGRVDDQESLLHLRPLTPGWFGAPRTADSGKQLGKADAEPARNPRQGGQLEVELGAFDAADVRPMKIGAFSELLLRQLQTRAQLPHPFPQRPPNMVHEPNRERNGWTGP